MNEAFPVPIESYTRGKRSDLPVGDGGGMQIVAVASNILDDVALPFIKSPVSDE